MGNAPSPANPNALTAFIACDRCGPYTRSAEVWEAKPACETDEDPGVGALLLSFCQSHADKFCVPLWNQGFRPIMKAPI